jgi:DedD protein
MEKKKLLIVAVSVGVVLLIIIGIPLLMIAPRQNFASAPSIEQDWVTAVEPIQRPLAEPEPPVRAETPALSQPVEAPQLTLTVPIPETAAVPSTPPAQSSSITVKSAPVKSVTVTQSAPAAKPAAPKETTKPPAAKPAADQSKTYSNYWVQTGAFSTKIRAEGAKDSLASKGITSIIDNRDIDGKTWYRVRVGPYMSETEANYWLALVKSIDGFSESQVRLTQVLR